MQYIAKRIIHKRFWQLVCLVGADGVIFGGTNPGTSRSFMLIVGFLLFSVTIYYILKGLLALAGLYGFPIRHRRRLLVVLTILSGGLTALQSIGQLSSRGVVALSLLAVLLYIYISRAKDMARKSVQVV